MEGVELEVGVVESSRRVITVIQSQYGSSLKLLRNLNNDPSLSVKGAETLGSWKLEAEFTPL
jgi:hypothetical protein